jgi:hypothetical protein
MEREGKAKVLMILQEAADRLEDQGERETSTARSWCQNFFSRGRVGLVWMHVRQAMYHSFTDGAKMGVARNRSMQPSITTPVPIIITYLIIAIAVNASCPRYSSLSLLFSLLGTGDLGMERDEGTSERQMKTYFPSRGCPGMVLNIVLPFQTLCAISCQLPSCSFHLSQMMVVTHFFPCLSFPFLPGCRERIPRSTFLV